MSRIRTIKQTAMECFERRIDRIEKELGSFYPSFTPIELRFFAALFVDIKFNCSGMNLIDPKSGDRANKVLIDYSRALFALTIIVESQIQLHDWRVDFLISCEEQRRFLIVECDGHDFHERTREQAAKDRARDRKFQQKGYTVFRFTGSEIYQDAPSCSSQVIEWIATSSLAEAAE
jgi:very-short-patch-repair endonuclease